MSPSTVVCPVPADIWGMDPSLFGALAGAVVGAVIAGLAAWLTTRSSEERAKKQRQLEAVAYFLDQTGLASEKWAKDNMPHSSALQKIDVFQAIVTKPETLASCMGAKLMFYGDLRRELEILDIKITNNEVRKTLGALEAFIQGEIDHFSEQQDFVLAPTRQKREHLGIEKGVEELQEMISSPMTDEFHELRRALKDSAREHLT
ncbi:hypothetical protein QVA66_10000 [Staphylococcus chromogenes]|nr:hypothetical protein [Staphylococcus chromogenes]